MMKSDKSEKGYFVVGNVVSNVLVLTCESQAIGGEKDGEAAVPKGQTYKAVRSGLMLSRLVLFASTPLPECERLVRHWLAYYNDETLVAAGVRLFAELFGGLPGAALQGEPDNDDRTIN